MKTLPFLTIPSSLSQAASPLLVHDRITGQARTPEHTTMLSSAAEMALCSSGEWYHSSPPGPSGMAEEPGLGIDPGLGQNQHSNVDNFVVRCLCLVCACPASEYRVLAAESCS